MLDEKSLDEGIENGSETSQKMREKESKSVLKKSTLRKDLNNIVLLLFLYCLQGIPIGLSFSIPMILGSRRISYKDQGTFSFAFWPYSLKLLWAPLVDSIYIKRLGRRKTWLISTLIINGTLMISCAEYIRFILDGAREKEPKDIYILTAIMAAIVFLVATQDIVTDGWSIELLHAENVQWQATCNTMGVGMGAFLGNAALLMLESVSFSNDYLRSIFGLPSQSYGVVTIDKFFYTFGAISIIVSIVILLFKREVEKKTKPTATRFQFLNSTDVQTVRSSETLERANLNLGVQSIHFLPSESIKPSISEAYKLIWQMLTLRPMKFLILYLITITIGFSSMGVVRLKMIEAGVAREKISLLGFLVSPVFILMPFCLSRFTNGPRPLDYQRKSVVLKLMMLIVLTVFVYFTPGFREAGSTSSYPIKYYLIYILITTVGSAVGYIYGVSAGAFFAQISDKKVGSSYMTFLSLWRSLGFTWSGTACLYIISWLTFKNCLPQKNISYQNGYNSSFIASSTKETYVITSTVFLKNTAYETNISNTSTVEQILHNKCSNSFVIKECSRLGGTCEMLIDPFYPVTGFFIVFGFVWFFASKKLTNYLQNVPKSDWLLK